MSFKLAANRDGGSQITRFVAQYKYRNEEWSSGKNYTLEPSHHDFLLGDLRPSQTYSIRFFAVNDIGVSDPSQEIVIETLDEGKDHTAVEVRVKKCVDMCGWDHLG